MEQGGLDSLCQNINMGTLETDAPERGYLTDISD